MLKISRKLNFYILLNLKYKNKTFLLLKKIRVYDKIRKEAHKNIYK